MRISLDELERALQNPGAFLDEAETDSAPPPRPGRHAFMKYALLKWHKGELTASEARSQTAQKCQKFKDKSDNEKTLKQFDEYVTQYNTIK